jgi:hypothetical protein
MRAHHSGSWDEAVNKAVLATKAYEFRRGRKDDFPSVVSHAGCARQVPGSSAMRMSQKSYPFSPVPQVNAPQPGRDETAFIVSMLIAGVVLAFIFAIVESWM